MLAVKILKKLSLITLGLGFGLSATVYAQNDNVARLSKAKTWNLARQLCKDIGPGWDLPKADQLEYALSKQLMTELLHFEVNQENPRVDLVIWVRSPDEEYNSQLINTSKALRYNSVTKEVTEFDASEEAMAGIQKYASELKQIPENLIRTDEEQKLFLEAVEQFKRLYPMSQIQFELYQPYEPSNVVLYYLPPAIFTPQIISIMKKISSELLISTNKNIDYLVQNFSEGIPVRCLKESN